MNYIEQIQTLQKKVENNKITNAKLQEREKTLKEEKDKLLEELKVYDISEQDLEGEIARIEEEVEKELNKCQEMLK